MKKVRSLQRLLIIGFVFSLFGMGMDAALAGSGTRRIVGGTPVGSGGWQAVAAIVDAGQNPYFGQFGGGTLIHPRWVVTAAQNVVIDAEGNTMEPEDIEVVLGLSDLLGEGGERIAVERIIVHPDYDAGTKGADVALLELAAESSQPVLSLYSGEGDLAGETAVALGWGIADHESFPSVLQNVEIPLVSHETGAAAYPDLTLPATILFAGSAEGDKGACDFDTGGPLMVAEKGGLRLAGIFSWGECGTPGKYGVFTRVAAVRAFIDANVSDIKETSWFPLAFSGGGWDTGITITNTGSETLSGLLRPFDYDGKGVSEMKSFSLAEGETAEYRLSVDFPNAGTVSHMAIHTNGGEMDAKFEIIVEGVYSASVPAASKIDNSDLALPLIQSDDRGWTGVALVNTTASARSMEMEFNTGDTRTLELEAGKILIFLIRDLFDGASRPDLTSAIIRNTGGIVGIRLIAGEPQLEGRVLAGEAAPMENETRNMTPLSR